MTLCQVCARLDIEQLDETDVRFHPNLKSLQQSAAAKCPFCALCYTRVVENTENSIIEALLNDRIPENYEVECFTPSVWLHGEMRQGNRGVGKDLQGCGIWISCGRLYPDGGLGETNRPGMPFASRLSVFAGQKTPAAFKYIDRFSTVDHDPDLYISLASWRLRRCKASHTLCNPASSDMPTRIIAVGKASEKPQLVTTGTLCEPYMALSYCWGPAKDTFTLTHETKAELFSGVAEEKLTRTHQEAIQIARSLGIGYVWIDALCILQGDADDWAFESQRMAQVYGNATLTIIAGRSSDAREGFLTNRLRQKVPPCALRISAHTEETLNVCLPRSTTVGPVSTRGWCFQEEKLSTRAIVFGQEQMIYQCREEQNWEDGQIKFHDLTPTFLAPDVSGFGGTCSPADKDATLDTWYRFIEVFTMRALSNPHDVFAAIASIAKLAQNVLGSRYLAGLWEKDLVRGLLWRPRPQVQAHPLCKEPLTRPRPTPFAPAPVIRAPSWSWASVEGPILRAYDRDPGRFRDSNYVKIKPSLGARWTANENCDVSELHMPACELQMVGRVAKVVLVKTGAREWFWADKSRRKWITYSRMLRHAVLLISPGEEGSDANSDDSVVAAGVFDVLEEAGDHEEMYCLPLIEKEGLMIVPHGNSWKRVGWFELRNWAWFEAQQEIEVRLV
ncbi:Putative heterokaryon incompatibility [Colletotrichum destructivum]|uniref:Heterokaryon incompatibility n=1 Tax=Colletotrichum destructivum TaxID=34406 RepID=A0AAX4IML1_9PEZI|nr:Putative heterokaryon incompatibility [Colletotrichum destructivum]